MDPSSKCQKLQHLPYQEKLGDITEDFHQNNVIIVQINNCISRKVHPHSLCWYISTKYPYGEPYTQRKSGPYPNLANPYHRPKLGSVQLRYPPKNTTGPVIACCFSQYRMGDVTTKYYLNGKNADSDYIKKSTEEDTYIHRVNYFKECLSKLRDIIKSMNEIEIICFPKYIGCGMAGGKWCDYLKEITQFCSDVKYVRPDIKIYLINKDNN